MYSRFIYNSLNRINFYAATRAGESLSEERLPRRRRAYRLTTCNGTDKKTDATTTYIIVIIINIIIIIIPRRDGRLIFDLVYARVYPPPPGRGAHSSTTRSLFEFYF